MTFEDPFSHERSGGGEYAAEPAFWVRASEYQQIPYRFTDDLLTAVRRDAYSLDLFYGVTTWTDALQVIPDKPPVIPDKPPAGLCTLHLRESCRTCWSSVSCGGSNYA